MEKLDILDREKFVEDLLRVVENISENKSSTCFALNGEWGCGKSFVLDMLEEQLSEIRLKRTDTDKYFVLRYNCWKYDYYEEPLVAIVARMIESIEKKKEIFLSEEKKRKIVDAAKIAGVAFLSIANASIKGISGIDLQNMYESVKHEKNDITEKHEKEYSHDVYFAFNKIMDKLRGLLKEIAKEYTVIIIVDELDRCLPEYAIKVLERLHHLTEETENIITIVAMDKNQLLSSVKHAFGFEKSEKYLEKFVHFEIKLDNGVASDKILKKYKTYLELFDKDVLPFKDSVEEYFKEIFKGIGVRTQEQIIQKAMLVHKLLYADRKDYSFMCMELLLVAIAFVYYEDADSFKRVLGIRNLNADFEFPMRKNKSSLVNFFEEKIQKLISQRMLSQSIRPNIYAITGISLYNAIIYMWDLLYAENANSAIVVDSRYQTVYDAIAKNREDLKKFNEMIQMMR